MRLRHLLKPLLTYDIHGSADPDITNMTTDSRRVTDGSLFVAISGFTVDGHEFAQQAITRGARALLVERLLPQCDVPQIVVKNTRHVSAVIADILFAHPSRRLRTIGVTGTNGKTTVTHIIRHLLECSAHPTGLMGTVGAKFGDTTVELPNTTPEVVEVHGLLREMVNAQCSHAVMEVSSHALVEGRVAGVEFDIGVFTNLTQDHLDFHGDMDRYAAAKSLLFARLGNGYGDSREDTAYAVLNADDPYAPVMAGATVVPCLTYGFSATADVRATDVVLTSDGARMNVDTKVGLLPIQTQLIGRFNVSNALAAVAVGLIEGIPPEDIAHALSTYSGVPGRCERVNVGQPFGVFVDYAHTPDGLANVLSSVREFVTGRLIAVVGCGGDRDKTKRPIMAQTATSLADIAILTSDNPRTEDPEAILDDMERGLDPGQLFLRQVDRRAAIREAVRLARPEDVIVIAGKGHEDYQIIGREKIHFDDREEAKAAIQARVE